MRKLRQRVTGFVPALPSCPHPRPDPQEVCPAQRPPWDGDSGAPAERLRSWPWAGADAGTAHPGGGPAPHRGSSLACKEQTFEVGLGEALAASPFTQVSPLRPASSSIVSAAERPGTCPRPPPTRLEFECLKDQKYLLPQFLSSLCDFFFLLRSIVLQNQAVGSKN